MSRMLLQRVLAGWPGGGSLLSEIVDGESEDDDEGEASCW